MYRAILYSMNVCKAVLSITALVVCLFLLNGCNPYVVTKTVYPELSLPVKPILPDVYEKETACLSNDVIKRLDMQQLLLIDYAHAFEDIINKVNEQHKKDSE